VAAPGGRKAGVVRLLETTCSSEVRCLEVQEAEVWFEYRQASREHNRPDRMGSKDGAKSWHKRALALNRPYTQIMLLHCQRILGMVCDG
jgi:hypothetical protein